MIGPASAPAEIRDNVNAALGRTPVDLVLRGGQIVNVYSEEIHPGDVAIHRGTIVAIRENFSGQARENLDVTGKFIAPALVDSIFHKSPRLTEDCRARGAGLVLDAGSMTRKVLRRPVVTGLFLEVRRALRNGRTVFLDERVGARVLGLLLGEVRLQGLDTSQICFAFDPAQPASGIRHPVYAALASGFSAPQAFQMAALNPAIHYCLDDRIGGVAPGRVANFLVYDELKTFHSGRLFVEGREVVLS